MNDSNTQAALDAGRAIGTIQFVGAATNVAPVVIVPQGYKSEILSAAAVEKWLPKPFRKTGDFEFADADSFIRYFLEHRDANSRIFAEISDSGGTFKGILNFHGSDPSFNDHVCSFGLEMTTEWARWCEFNKKNMSQVEFATFLEENAELFSDPKGADLLELIRNLEGHANISVNSAVKLQTGAIKLAYDEDVVLKGSAVTQAGSMDLPQILTVGIAPFQGVNPFSIKARLRYSISNRKISFRYETIDAHLIIRAVCQQVVDLIKEKTSLVPFLT